MAFQYYQNNTAGWGSNQFQFGPPPTYGFQPQQHWRAYDFYSAHAPHPQTEIFQYAMNRLSSGAGPLGVGMHEARHWHRRAYGGIGDITRMLPSEIGHAAAYEAYRSWIHRSPTFQILDGDLERQKEALISLAIAEAAQLWEATGRGYDQYALQTASETAAATASLIFSQTVDHQMLGNDYYRARNATYPNAGDAYAMDDMALMQRQQMGGGMMGGPGGMMNTGTLGGLPRPASAGPIPTPGIRGSPYMGASPMVGGSPYMGAAPMGGSPYAASASPYAVGGGAAPAAGVGGFVQPGAGAGMVPGQAGTASSVQYGSSISSTYPGIENARPTTYGASGYGSNVVPGPPGGTFGGGALGTGGYGAGAGGYGAGAGTYGAGGYGAGGYGAGGYGAGSYGAGGYGGGYGAGGYGAQPQQPVVVVERRRSRHGHGHHHRRHHSVPRTGYY